MFQGGTSTGRKVLDFCATATAIDTADWRTSGPGNTNCHRIDPFQTTLRGFASYTIPTIDVLVSATLRSQPPNERVATWNVLAGS